MSPANQDPLAQLNDIIAPSAPHWWPPAAIYWLLLIAFAVLIIGAIYLFNKVKKEGLKQQQALQKLQQLKQANANFISLNQLLKGVALLYFPRQQVASLHSEKWFDFLHCYAASPIFESKQAFLKRLYSQGAQDCSDNDFAQVKIWIKNLPRQIKKQQKKANNNG